MHDREPALLSHDWFCRVRDVEQDGTGILNSLPWARARCDTKQGGSIQAASPPRKRFMTSSKNRGFSLLELMIVLAVGLTMAGVTFMAMMPLFKENHVDQAYDTTLSVIRNYRNLSITQSKRYILTFTAPGTITVQYWGVAVPVSPAPVTVASYTLPPDIKFAVQAGFPAAAPDTFGTGVVAIDFDQGMGLGSQPYIMFMPMTGLRRTRWGITTVGLSISRIPAAPYTRREPSMCGALPEESGDGGSTTRAVISGCNNDAIQIDTI